jgi:Rrf2 family protein
MHVLGRAGLVRSIRGAGGGYQFVGNARRTTLLDVVQLFEDLSSAEQGTGSGDATHEEQTLSGILNEVDEIAHATLGSITIATMRKLVDRRDASEGQCLKAGATRRRNAQRL